MFHEGGACIPHVPDAALSGSASPAHGAGASVAANRLMTRPEGDHREAVLPAREGQGRPRSPAERVDDVVNVGNIVTQTADLVRCLLKSPFDC